MEDADNQELMKFPCEFPLKVMGRAAADFAATVEEIVDRHIGRESAREVSERPSRQGNYVSVTITFTAQSRAQLDALYRELTAHQRILMVL